MWHWKKTSINTSPHVCIVSFVRRSLGALYSFVGFDWSLFEIGLAMDLGRNNEEQFSLSRKLNLLQVQLLTNWLKKETSMGTALYTQHMNDSPKQGAMKTKGWNKTTWRPAPNPLVAIWHSRPCDWTQHSDHIPVGNSQSCKWVEVSCCRIYICWQMYIHLHPSTCIILYGRHTYSISKYIH